MLCYTITHYAASASEHLTGVAPRSPRPAAARRISISHTRPKDPIGAATLLLCVAATAG